MKPMKLDPTTFANTIGTPHGAKATTYDEAKRVGEKANLTQAAKGFEAMFLQTMMQEMHAAKLDDGLFNSDEEKPFQTMLESSYSDLATKKGQFGLADAITRSLAKQVYGKSGSS